MATDEKTISYKGPPGSCDCHMHVFGDPVRYPYAADRRNSPPADPLEKFLDDYLLLAHFGMFRGRSGAASPGFKRFLDLLRHGERRCWVKLTAPYRIGSPPLYEDAVPIARALIELAPDRVIWGSDYPFLSHADRVSAVALFNLIPTWAPDASMRKQILVDNPQELFGF